MKPDLDFGYKLGFRVALTYFKTKRERNSAHRDVELHRRRWRARCFALGALATAFPFLGKYNEFKHRRSACDSRDVLPRRKGEDDKPDDGPIFHCNQSWICPWCSVRPTLRVLRRTFTTLKANEDKLDSMVWQAAGWTWDLGPIDRVEPGRVDDLLESLSKIRKKICGAVSRNTRVSAFLSRIRVLPGRALEKGSPPPLMVSYRHVFLGLPDALVSRRWCHRPGAPGDGLGSLADDPHHPVVRYIDLCRYLAAYPPGLLFSSPLALAHLLRVKEGLRPKRKLLSSSFGL